MDDEEDHRYEFVYLDQLEALDVIRQYFPMITRMEHDRYHSRDDLSISLYFLLEVLLEFSNTSRQYFHHQMVEYHRVVHREEHQDSKYRPQKINITNISIQYEKNVHTTSPR